MNCPNCGTENEKDAAFCAGCGTKMVVETVENVVPVAPAPQPAPQPVMAEVAQKPVAQQIPEEYKPLSAWAYFGWQLLFAIPVVGFVLLIVMSFAPRNKNLKSFTRSHWCALLVFSALALLIVIIAAAAGVGLTELFNQLT